MINTLFILSYMLATSPSGQVAKDQEQLGLKLKLDPILLVAESESRAIEPQNINTLLKIKMEFVQAKKGVLKN